MSDERLDIRDNAAARRIEVEIDGRLAQIAYRMRGNVIVFTHTEVPPELEGRGIASRMARFALDLARDRELEVIPLCPFVAAYIHRHAEYEALVPEQYRGR